MKICICNTRYRSKELMIKGASKEKIEEYIRVHGGELDGDETFIVENEFNDPPCSCFKIIIDSQGIISIK